MTQPPVNTRHPRGGAVRTSLVLLLMTVALVACEDTPCTPTFLSARDASIVVAPDAARSGVFQARLTTTGAAPLPDKKVTFSVEDALVGSPILGSADTNARGDARLDLKSRPLRFVKTVTEDRYIASFARDGTYCSSSDTAALDIAHVG